MSGNPYNRQVHVAPDGTARLVGGRVRSKAMFQKRHYKAVAEILRTQVAGAYRCTVVRAFADTFEKDNPLFNRSKFYDACRGGKV